MEGADKERIKQSGGSEGQFRRFFDQMPDTVIIIDRKGVLLEASEMAEELSGYKKEELIGKNIITGFPILDLKTKALVLKKLVLHFSGKDIPTFEIEIHRKDGGIIPLELNPKIIDYMGKKVEIVVLRDISERKESEGELKRLNEELKSKVEELDKFNKMAVGRELRMAELKKKVKELEEKLHKKHSGRNPSV
jgi:PAS domain S-box-containing protein